MLQAVSTMLDCKGNSEVLSFQTQVSCAKTILDKVIEGLDEGHSTRVIHPTVHEILDTEAALLAKKEPERKPVLTPDGQYKIVKDESDRIVRIDGLALDGAIELDGKVMSHKEAIGKKFTTGRIL